jgi:dihydropteroate synthase
MRRRCAVVQARTPVVIMHARPLDPRTMQRDIHYEDAATEVARFLEARVETLERLGIPRSRIAVDPGIGFGKRRGQSGAGRAAAAAGEYRLPILLGASRKRLHRAGHGGRAARPSA